MLNMPVVPTYKPDPSLVAAIRAHLERIKLQQTMRRVDAARRVGA